MHREGERGYMKGRGHLQDLGACVFHDLVTSALIFLSLTVWPCYVQAGIDKAADQKRLLVERRLNEFQHWCDDLFTALPEVVYLPEALNDKEGLLTEADVVQGYRSMSPEAQRAVEQLLLKFDSKRMVFHNPIPQSVDIVATLGRQEAALNLDSGVVALVSYPGLKEKFGEKSFDLPPFMDDFVRQIAGQLIKALDRQEQTTVREFPLTFQDVSGKSGLMWLETIYVGKRSITISPLFVRTLFAAATSENRKPCSARIKNLSELYKHRERTVADVEDLLNRLEASFRQGLAFPIAHELAHAYLPADRRGDEEECDLAGIRNLQKAGMPIELGAFESILGRAIQEKREDLWGIEPGVQASAVVERLCGLRVRFKLDGNGSTLCPVPSKKSSLKVGNDVSL